jgi:hypothetical protein
VAAGGVQRGLAAERAWGRRGGATGGPRCAMAARTATSPAKGRGRGGQPKPTKAQRERRAASANSAMGPFFRGMAAPRWIRSPTVSRKVSPGSRAVNGAVSDHASLVGQQHGAVSGRRVYGGAEVGLRTDAASFA